MIDATEPLLAYERQQIARFETSLRLLRPGISAPSPATCTLGSWQPPRLRRSSRCVPDNVAADTPGGDPLAPLDDALAFLRGGMSALRRRRARGR